ncbi:MAG: Dabb family protein [Blastocatellia bacterium]
MNSITRRVLIGCALLAFFAAGVVVGQNKFSQPKSVVHVVTVKWKADSTAEQRQKALDGVAVMGGKIKGIKNVWLKTLRVQSPSQDKPFDAAFAIEFESEAAAKAYADDPAHKEWEGVYTAIREESRSHQVTN